jgi:5-methylcytosine-specific restriction endonuclease McrA
MIWFFANFIGKNIRFKCLITILYFAIVITCVNYNIMIKENHIIALKLPGILSQDNIMITHSNANKNMKNMGFLVIDSAF